jgi:hypothetical protein
VNNKFCFVFERRREEIQTIFFYQSGQHFCNSLHMNKKTIISDSHSLSAVSMKGMGQAFTLKCSV